MKFKIFKKEIFFYLSVVIFASLWTLGKSSAYFLCMDFVAPASGAPGLSLSFFFDTYSFCFLVTVLMIFTTVYSYSLSYMNSEVYLKRFLMILSLFVCSMVILILSGDLFTSFIGWDGLGITSLLLIFYYYSPSAFKAGLLTFLMNRVGDCFFITTILLTMVLSNSQMLISSSFFQMGWSLVVVTALTKSAQVPFSAWLPSAMEAPTPVSALVHSSTLVTAGVYLLIRYHSLWSDGSKDTNLMLMFSAMATMAMASLSALVEMDVKKIVALSTLSQLGFMMFSLSFGLKDVCFFHMIMHAFFKANLFMSVGYLIHSNSLWQDTRKVELNSNSHSVVSVVFVYCNLALCGFPFLAGFYSKDMVLDLIINSTPLGVLTGFTIIFSFVLTVLYTMRMMTLLSWNCFIYSFNSSFESPMALSLLPLFFMSCFMGSVYSWMFVEPSLWVDSSKSLMLIILFFFSLLFISPKSNLMLKFLESKSFLNYMNSILSNLYFSYSKLYIHSSDLSSIGGWGNKTISNVSLNFSNLLNMKNHLVFNSFDIWWLSLLGLIMMIMP